MARAATLLALIASAACSAVCPAELRYGNVCFPAGGGTVYFEVHRHWTEPFAVEGRRWKVDGCVAVDLKTFRTRYEPGRQFSAYEAHDAFGRAYWGGWGSAGYLADGGSYDPGTNTWSSVPAIASARAAHRGVDRHEHDRVGRRDLAQQHLPRQRRRLRTLTRVRRRSSVTSSVPRLRPGVTAGVDAWYYTG